MVILISDLQSEAPVLFKLLTCVVSHSDKGNAHKHRIVHYPAISMAVATVLKERNKNMIGMQILLSLLLFKSCAQKQIKFIGKKMSTTSVI